MKYLFGFFLFVLIGCTPDLGELNKKAQELENAQDYAGALKVRAQILNEIPNDIDALYNRGVCQQGTGELGLAELDYKKVLALDSMHVEALFNLGALYQGTNEFGKSIIYFSKIIGVESAVFNLEINGENEEGINIYNEAIYQRGNTHFMNKNWEAAKKDYERCLDLKYKIEKSTELITFCNKQF